MEDERSFELKVKAKNNKDIRQAGSSEDKTDNEGKGDRDLSDLENKIDQGAKKEEVIQKSN